MPPSLSLSSWLETRPTENYVPPVRSRRCIVVSWMVPWVPRHEVELAPTIPRALVPAPFPEVFQRFPTGSKPEEQLAERPEPRDTGLVWFTAAAIVTLRSDNKQLKGWCC
ncbi:hypothetical protein CSOJ01_12184 [Colletotrichum sojae]|uniref:Uncharacterized protein n=1 Tax=Colletotrichum sojae TaxID=2175907 RepID=A0A8H6MLX5_9PEZI|nr:hypothetical protein CSOJ01_12184 [Colletotrichum sojae]